ncbi:hypothetical protein QTN25_010726 [Entamoeba marina]
MNWLIDQIEELHSQICNAKINCRLTAVHLIDLLYISNSSTYMDAILQGLISYLLSSYRLGIHLTNFCSSVIEDILFDVPERFAKISKGLAGE